MPSCTMESAFHTIGDHPIQPFDDSQEPIIGPPLVCYGIDGRVLDGEWASDSINLWRLTVFIFGPTVHH